MKFRKNLILIIAISIPLLLLIIIALSIYLPMYMDSPEGRFLYAVCEDFGNSAVEYSVTEGHLAISDSLQAEIETEKYEVILYVHDLEKDHNTLITFDEAAELDIDTSQTSGSGLKLTPGSKLDGIFPFSIIKADSSTRYIRGRFTARKLDLELVRTDKTVEFRFLGWIK
ncbi:MAG: hypothetical protein GY863_19075 [bacterium]|nr:hypothetical protein [bacterium]